MLTCLQQLHINLEWTRAIAKSHVAITRLTKIVVPLPFSPKIRIRKHKFRVFHIPNELLKSILPNFIL